MRDKITIMNRARLRKRAQHDISVINKASELFNRHKNEPLFVAGIMLYWAEGRTSKSQNGTLEISNSDSKLLKIFRDFLKKYLNINGKLLKARLFLYPDLNTDEITAFWSRALNIPKCNFIQPHNFHSYPRLTRKKLPYGTCSIYIYNKDMRLTIDRWIDCFANMRR